MSVEKDNDDDEPVVKDTEETPPSPEERFREILRGVNIDETTVHIDDTDETRDKESVAVIEDVIDKLDALLQNVTDFKLCRSITDKSRFLNEVMGAIYQGAYFSSIDDVWESKQESLETVEVKLFDRTYDMLHHMPAGNGYMDTINGAIDSNNIVTDDDDSLRSASNALNVFGAKEDTSGPAHLLPHAPNCAAMWYHLVPWVL